MRKALVLLALVAIAIPTGLVAQATSAVSAATVDATVIRSLSLTKLSPGNLSFGLAAQGTSKSANYRANGAAQFRALGQVSTVVDVSFGTAALAGGSYVLTFTPTVAGGATANKTSASVLVSGADITLGATAGDYFFFIGGVLEVPLDAPPGSYSGAWTLTLAYTST
jgi:hypothetical protein